MVTYTPYGGAIEHSGDGGRVTGRVYRVGHKAPSVEARYMAAVKAGGDDALLCDGAAGYLLEILRCRTVPSPSVLTPTARRIKGVRVKRTRRVDPRDATKVRNIPVARMFAELRKLLR